MRTAVSILCFFLAAAVTLSAQKGDKVEAMRVAYITKHVALSAAEAERFWPVYNEYHDKLRLVRKSLRQAHRHYSETMSEEDVKALASREMEFRKAETEIHHVYSARIAGIIGHRKYMRLRLAEEQFRREMLKILRDREEEDK
jgi:hypothetical protein